jgi:hypothetical protein
LYGADKGQNRTDQKTDQTDDGQSFRTTLLQDQREVGSAEARAAA